jgi:hypothetical protein
MSASTNTGGFTPDTQRVVLLCASQSKDKASRLLSDILAETTVEERAAFGKVSTIILKSLNGGVQITVGPEPKKRKQETPSEEANRLLDQTWEMIRERLEKWEKDPTAAINEYVGTMPDLPEQLTEQSFKVAHKELDQFSKSITGCTLALHYHYGRMYEQIGNDPSLQGRIGALWQSLGLCESTVNSRRRVYRIIANYPVLFDLGFTSTEISTNADGLEKRLHNCPEIASRLRMPSRTATFEIKKFTFASITPQGIDDSEPIPLGRKRTAASMITSTYSSYAPAVHPTSRSRKPSSSSKGQPSSSKGRQTNASLPTLSIDATTADDGQMDVEANQGPSPRAGSATSMIHGAVTPPPAR